MSTLRKKPSESAATYCARLYEEYGLEFVDGLNSKFAGIVYDTEDDSVTLFVDRLSARPIYYAHGVFGRLFDAASIASRTPRHRPDVRYGLRL
ncbi:hypothetical protein [Halorubrum sp. Ea8]|uniref:hypothetical protein n=1 Tax=Halorubrum sp. Ea8 TaxID=1383841 RepID=UPI0015954E1E